MNKSNCKALNDFLLSGDESFLLFRRQEEVVRDPIAALFQIPGDNWKGKPLNTIDVFCTISKDPKEITRWIRQEPTYEYFVVVGKAFPVKAAVSITMQGMNLDTLQEEWKK